MLDWRGWTGIVLLLTAVIGALVLDRVTRSEVNGPSIILMSPLLDWDLPGTLPHPDRAGATARLKEAAERLHFACNGVEVYRTTEPAVVHSTLEDAQAERHYLRYRDKKTPGLSRWEGPNRLLMVESQDELLLCALDWPISG